ncbi:CHAT domain-containing protein [Kibdelosporangium aridum]|uniref:CHAT domain-containing protein n=1 Tax=Kibdelosporangium aridum TaxID=2030 RepID=A0A1Y5YCI2_KIBAR|nr:CHAT domain-containing protein [Kibdelosporangium aridum]SMD27481.1 CHAT domain-containing protein [Kibdelosporangium aridum]
MKYPHIHPVGAEMADRAWRLAATDLPGAAQLSAPVDGGVVPAVRHVEILRRIGKSTTGRELLQALRPAGAEVPLVVLAVANTYWTQARATEAIGPYKDAERGYADLGDPDGVLAARIGLARAARMSYQKDKWEVLDAAIAAGDGSTDIHLHADLHRERSAWEVLVGNHESATAFAERAADVHRSVGDRYLIGLAEVLRARALNAAGDRSAALDLMRTQLAAATEIGSDELKMVTVVYVAQFLQRGVAVGGPEWALAKKTITDALEEAEDPFTVAELILPLAHLHTTGGEFAEAERCLDEYGRCYEAMGGNAIGTANLLKARARLELARNGGRSVRGFLRLPRSLNAVRQARKTLRASARAYEEAGLSAGADSARWHLELVDILGSGHSKGARRLTSTARDALDRARDHLLYAEQQNAAGNTALALDSYRTAEAEAVDSGATMFAIAAAAGSALMAYALGDHTATAEHIRAAIRHSEKIRRAVATPDARRHITDTVRAQYEHAMLLAVQIGDGELAVELAERLRTDRLAGLLRRGDANLPPDLAGLLTEIARVGAALAERDPSQRGVRSPAAVDDLLDQTPADLRRRLDGLYVQLSEQTNDLFADVYGAEPLRMERLGGIRQDVLIVMPVQSAEGDQHVISMWRSPDGTCVATVAPVTGEMIQLREALLADTRDGRILLRAGNLDVLSPVLPAAFATRLRAAAEPVPLVVIPTGWLWAVPFAALPLPGGDLLVDHADLVLAPSLRFLTALQHRNRAGTPPSAAVSWHDPHAGINAPELDGLEAHPAGHDRITDTAQVVPAFVRGGDRWRSAVLAAHGNREPGLAQAVLAEQSVVLSAADFLDGTTAPPPYLSFASCHSGYPSGDDHYEPLGLALAALAAGATHVISTHFEIGSQDQVVSSCLSRLYQALPTAPSPATALASILRDPSLRQRRLYRWAALAVIGTN